MRSVRKRRKRPDNVWLLGLLEQYENGVMQKDMALALGVSRTTVCHWIKAALDVKRETARARG